MMDELLLPEFSNSNKESDIIDPLKHLFSLQLDNMPSLINDSEYQKLFPKRSKKVRFSDEVRQITCDDELSDSSISLQSEKITSDVKVVDSSLADDFFVEEIDTTSQNLNCSSNEQLNKGTESSENQNAFENVELCEDNYDLDSIDDVAEVNKLSSKIECMSLDSKLGTDGSSLNIESARVVSHNIKEHYLETVNNTDHDTNVKLYDASKKTKSKGQLSIRLGEETVYLKQSEKINAVLRKNLNYSNAQELKTTVFKAWCKVKNKSPASAEVFVVENRSKIINVESRNNVASKRAYALWKKSKSEAVKSSTVNRQKKSTSNEQKHSNADDYEREMAFKMWKKNKDEISKQKLTEQRQSEQKNITALHLKDSEKKKNAEAAFCMWKTHKLHDGKQERKRKSWLLLHEQEESIKRLSREKDALKMYFLWLESKSCSNKSDSFSYTPGKPPWFPP